MCLTFQGQKDTMLERWVLLSADKIDGRNDGGDEIEESKSSQLKLHVSWQLDLDLSKLRSQ
jgi:hypothetical protein